MDKITLQTDKITQQNIFRARETSSASEELNAQAAQMKFFVDELISIIRGKAK